ncbi:MAG TPA: FAD-dependent oxidoreductase [Clostridiaceae bacterium]|nr:FAD-dependent oxidoreductase [Clostridiaceae bacterium]
MIRINIDGQEIKTHAGYTIKQVAERHGIFIPTLCEDEKLKSYGSCGLCVVEVEGNPKLIRSCSIEARDGMVIHTHTPRVLESRKTTLELFLSNHTGDCKAPCTLACPSHVDIQAYVGLTGNGQFEEALKVIKEDLPLPASIGRVCPHPCMTDCRRQLIDDPIQIHWIKRYAADLDLASENPWMPKIKPASGQKVAVVGGGPSGLSAAYFLLQEGHAVTIYEANAEFGGMLHYGIPMYRLPKDVLRKEVEIIEKMGAKLVPNTRLGRDISLEHLRAKYDAVYLAIGLWKSTPLRVPGEDLDGVFGGIDFLYDFVTAKPLNIGKRVAVIGGGNTAMDAARTAVRLGASEVLVLYRRTKEDMPAEEIEIIEAEEEGVQFHFTVSPLEVNGDANGRVQSIRLQKMRAIPPADGIGRSRIEPIEGEEEIIEIDSLIVATGQGSDLTGFEDVETTRWGYLDVDPSTFQTNLDGVFAGGDIIDNGNKIAIQAIADGKNAAGVIDSYLKGDLHPYRDFYYVRRDDVTRETIFEMKPDLQEQSKLPMDHISPAKRKDNFEEFVLGYTEDAVKAEGMRCLECGCMDYAECELFMYGNDYNIDPDRLKGEKHTIDYCDEHPYIVRDPNKCIVCGQCVRVCDEVMDIGALGLVERGFDVTVQPSMEKPLEETDCIACGQCIAICPVGALQERRPNQKQVPLKGETTQSTCYGCSVGCAQTVETRGTVLLRTLPVDKDDVSGGLLCKKGRFEHDFFWPVKDRLMVAKSKRGSVLESCTLSDAMLKIARGAQAISLVHGSEHMAVTISGNYTNEEIFLARKFAEKYLGTKKFGSLSYRHSGLKCVLGYDASPNTYNELGATDLIIAIGGDIFDSHTMVALKIKQATEDGIPLIDINPEKTKLRDWADTFYEPECTRAFLKAILDPDTSNDEAKAVAEAYRKARRAMIVYSKADVTAEEEELIAKIAVEFGHIGAPRNGIIQLKHSVNEQGLVDMGVVLDRDQLLAQIDSGDVKGLVIFGEELPEGYADKLSFLAVQTLRMNPTAEKADVVLPAAAFIETDGFVTSSERRISRVRQALKPVLGLTNFEMIRSLMRTFDVVCDELSRQDILGEIVKWNANYVGVQECDFVSGYWPLLEDRQLAVRKAE